MSRPPRPPQGPRGDQNVPSGAALRTRNTTRNSTTNIQTQQNQNPGGAPGGGTDVAKDVINVEVRVDEDAELSEAEFLELLNLFDRLDEDGSGSLSIKELMGMTVAGQKIDEQAFKRMDKDRSGFLSHEEIAAFLYPRIPRRRLQGYFARFILPDVFAQLRGAFDDAANSDGLMTEKKIKDAGEALAGHKLSVERLRTACENEGKVGLTFTEVMVLLYPFLIPQLVDRYNVMKLYCEDMLLLKAQFDALDKDGKGVLTQRDFNRSSQGPRPDSRGDELRSPSRNMNNNNNGVGFTGGVGFDLHMFNRVDKDRLGSVTFAQYIRFFHPLLTERQFRQLMDYYTLEKFEEIATQRNNLLQEEARRRAFLIAEIEKRATRLIAEFHQKRPDRTEDEDEWDGDDAFDADFDDLPIAGKSERSLAHGMAAESILQRRQRESQERGGVEGSEDGQRWQVVVGEHHERIQIMNALNASCRRVAQRALLGAVKPEGIVREFREGLGKAFFCRAALRATIVASLVVT